MIPAPSFAARIEGAAARFPGHVAIERVGAEGVQSTTYAALIAHAGRWSALLAARGVTRGDRVAMLGENDEPWIAAYLGTLRLGAVAVPLDTAYRPDQVRTIVGHCQARILCATPRYLETAQAAMPAARDAVALLDRLPEEADGASAGAPALVAVDAQTPAVILYTSGTTADPKGVVLTHANLDAERTAALSVVDCHERDAVLGVLPLFHALAQMANLLVPLTVGARVVFLETVNSTTLLAALQERGITIFVCVPQFFYLIHQRVMSETARASAARRAIFRLLLRANGWLREHAGRNPGRRWFHRVHRALGPSMRLLVTGGSRFDPSIGRDLYDLGFTLLNGYGLTETSGAATAQRPGDRYNTSVGQPLSGVEIKIACAPGPSERSPGPSERSPGPSGPGSPPVVASGFSRTCCVLS